MRKRARPAIEQILMCSRRLHDFPTAVPVLAKPALHELGVHYVACSDS